MRQIIQVRLELNIFAILSRFAINETSFLVLPSAQRPCQLLHISNYARELVFLQPII